MRLCLIGPPAALCIGLSGGNAGADVLVTKRFKYDTPDPCKTNGDIWFCSFRGGVGTVTLQGDANSHDFLLTIKGELQPQAAGCTRLTDERSP